MNYDAQAREKWEQCQKSGQAVILAIESSCDETAAAIVRNGREICSNVLYSQIAIHKEYGGVVPEIASRSHVEKMQTIVKQAMDTAHMTFDDIDAVAVTAGPGLIGCLLTGISYAKGLALARQWPLIAVHHIKGHICANFLVDPDLKPPFLCLVVSGGHSHIIAVEAGMNMRVIGATRDDAAGEAFDKAARALGLPYPGGPELEKLAREGDPYAYAFPSGFNAGEHDDFSFSGLKTAVINLLHRARQKGETIAYADAAASFQHAVTDILVSKAVRACKRLGYPVLALAGGVASNGLLRNKMEQAAQNEGLRFVCPPKSLCTDNAAMIACAAFDSFQKGKLASLDLNGRAGWRIEES